MRIVWMNQRHQDRLRISVSQPTRVQYITCTRDHLHTISLAQEITCTRYHLHKRSLAKDITCTRYHLHNISLAKDITCKRYHSHKRSLGQDITWKQGGMSWLAFGYRSRIPQSFCRARICKFSRQKRHFLQLRENRPFVVVKRLRGFPHIMSANFRGF